MALHSSPRRRCCPLPRPCSVPALGGGAFQGGPSLLNCETRQCRPCSHLCFCPFTRNHGESATWASLFPALPGTQDSPSVGAWLVLACPCPCHSGGPMTHVGTASLQPLGCLCSWEQRWLSQNIPAFILRVVTPQLKT